jgi:hypothetical protein
MQGGARAVSGRDKIEVHTSAAADLKPDPINRLGIIVNLSDRTVTFSDYVIPISGVTSTLISFMARQAPVVLGLKSKPFTVGRVYRPGH